jgi:hypothetical protein
MMTTRNAAAGFNGNKPLHNGGGLRSHLFLPQKPALVFCRGIDMQQATIEVARPLSISVHERIIVGKEGYPSLKGLNSV